MRGSGCVDDLCIREAYAQMKIDVTAPNPIRQVKVMDHFGHTVYDTDVMENGGRTFAKEIRVETPYTYTILVVTNDGDVKTVKYPAGKTGSNSGKAE